jgi:single-strand DNA-binding protein
MSYLNKALLIGRVVNDPEVITGNDGSTFTKFRLATNEVFKDKQGKQIKKTEYHHIIAFNKVGEIAVKYLEKGKLIYVEGKIRTKEWRTESGEIRKIFSIFCDELRFLSSSPSYERPEVTQNNSSEDLIKQQTPPPVTL